MSGKGHRVPDPIGGTNPCRDAQRPADSAAGRAWVVGDLGWGDYQPASVTVRAWAPVQAAELDEPYWVGPVELTRM